MLKHFGMGDYKSIGTFFDTKAALKRTDEEYDEDVYHMLEVPYKSTVGSIIYAIVDIRANLAYAIS